MKGFVFTGKGPPPPGTAAAAVDLPPTSSGAYARAHCMPRLKEWGPHSSCAWWVAPPESYLSYVAV